jgi:predicted transcriptional regulator of viral defense system
MAVQTDRSPTRQRARALELLADRGMVRLSEFRDAGIAQETVARLAREGTILRLARGLYQLPEAAFDANHTLAEAAKLVPRAVVCLLSATQFHRLTVHTPSAVWLAIDRTARKPRIAYPPLRIVRFSGSAVTLGVEEHAIEGVPVRVTDPARTIVDCFRYRNKIGLDVGLEALREGLRARRCDPDDLYHYAHAMKAWSVLRPYLEAMLADGA